MGIFKTKKNNKYNYTPRFYKGERSPFELKHKFDDARVTIEKTNLKGKIVKSKSKMKRHNKTKAKIINNKRKETDLFFRLRI